MRGFELLQGNNKDILPLLDENTFDSCVTDPPYGLKFMGKKWDYQVPSVKEWEGILRVMKPGAFLLAFGGSRTFHRMCVNIEDAGFEIRDTIMWLYGSGMPKGLNIGKKVDGWDDYHTALKPAFEPIIMAMKPFDTSVTENVKRYGVGGLNIGECRIEAENRPLREVADFRDDVEYSGRSMSGRKDGSLKSSKAVGTTNLGRFPANIIHDGSEEVIKNFPVTKSGEPGIRRKEHETNSMSGRLNLTNQVETGYGDEGSAARFFYCSKASKSDKDFGLSDKENKHPTVKPIDLMKYLVRLVTPKEGLILDPYCGSGTTGVGALLEDFGFVGIDQDDIEIARERLNSASKK